MLHRATVTSVSPLKVRLRDAGELPALRAPWSSYSPVVGHGVLVDFVSDNRQVVVMGKAS